VKGFHEQRAGKDFEKRDFLYHFTVLLSGSDSQQTGRSEDRNPAEEKFSAPVLDRPPVKWVRGPFPGVKRPELGVDHTQSSAEVKKEYSFTSIFPYGPSCPVLRRLFWLGTENGATIMCIILKPDG
jgi:hypothetical protein